MHFILLGFGHNVQAQCTSTMYKHNINMFCHISQKVEKCGKVTNDSAVVGFLILGVFLFSLNLTIPSVRSFNRGCRHRVYLKIYVYLILCRKDLVLGFRQKCEITIIIIFFWGGGSYFRLHPKIKKPGNRDWWAITAPSITFVFIALQHVWRLKFCNPN